MKSIQLQKLLSHQFLKSSLIPILTIELILLGLYFGVNHYISIQTKETLISQVKNVALPLVENNATLVNIQLNELARQSKSAALQTQNWMTNPEKYSSLQKEPTFTLNKTGAMVKKDNGGCGLFYGKNQKSAPQDKTKKALNSEALDPIYSAILASNPHIAAVYINTWDDMTRLCPFIDKMWHETPASMEIDKFNFYYLADSKHNPARKTVWTEVYFDPAGQGWMASAITPIYKNNFLEGVVGVDVTVNELTHSILKQKLPWNASLFLMDSTGMVLAIDSAAEKALGLKKNKAELQTKEIIKTVLQEEHFNLLKSSIPEISTHFSQLIHSKLKTASITLLNKEYILAHAHVPETNWKLMLLVEEKNVIAPVSLLSDLSRNLGYAMIGFMILFYIIFFGVLIRQAAVFSSRIAKPVEDLTDLAKKIGENKVVAFAVNSGITEIDELGLELQNMQSDLIRRSELLIQEKVAHELQATQAEQAYQFGLFESTSAYLHNIGNALAGISGYLNQLEKINEATDQWPGAFELIGQKIGNDADSAYTMLKKLEEIQVTYALPQLAENIKGIRKAHFDMVTSIRRQQDLFVNKKLSEEVNTQLDLGKIIHDILETHSERFLKNFIEIETDLEQVAILSHPYQIKSGITNLILNAVDAILSHPESSKLIRIYVKASARGAQVIIEDTGIGYNDEIKAKLFQQGFTTKSHGHGLGLYSLREFLERRGGELSSSSKGFGKGAQFIMDIKNES
jgi:signal transduction histidine kinase